MPRLLRAFVALAWIAAGASCDAGPTCRDEDRDGLGAGCSAGPDCDDENAARGEDCDAVPPPDCTADPAATGCSCLAGSLSDCYPGPSGTAGVGTCRAGRTRCVSGHWGLCEGSVAPERERCDDVDQDCDGVVDEGVRSPCGGCMAACDGAVWGDPFTEAGENLALTAFDELTLARDELASGTVWAVNSAEGTVSRIDAEGAVETARYATGDRDAFALEPSRVAVDWNGDAWIANRAFEGTPTVVRIAREGRCEDRDDDGVLETSSGPTDVRAWGSDECVMSSVVVGAPREVARAIAIDGDRGLEGASGGDAWVGLHDGQAFVEIDGLTGDVLRRVETPGFSPYSAAFDPFGRLWAIARDGLLLRIDPAMEPPSVEIFEVPLACWLLYGLAVDPEGRVAMTGFSCDSVTVYDPRTSRWSTTRVAASARGAAFAGDELWIAHTGGSVSRVSLDPLQVREHRELASDELTPVETIGVGVDGLGHVWTVSGLGGPGGVGLATRIDIEGDAPNAQVPIGLAPHSQGDPTGLFSFGELLPEGHAERVFTGCETPGETRWQRVHLAADPGSAGRVVIAVRHAADEASLAGASFTTIGALPDDVAPFAIDAPEGGVLEVRVTLEAEGSLAAPRVTRIGVEWDCPGPG